MQMKIVCKFLVKGYSFDEIHAKNRPFNVQKLFFNIIQNSKNNLFYFGLNTIRIIKIFF